MSDDVARDRPAPRVPTIDDFPESGTNALATFSQRAWARVLDTVLMLYVASLIASSIPLDYEDPDKVTQTLIVLLLVWTLVAGVYEVVAVALLGTTLGKLALGTRIARFTDGGRPTWSQATQRCLLPLVGAAVLGVLHLPVVGAAIVYMSSLSNPLSRGWHDQAGGTIVIRTR